MKNPYDTERLVSTIAANLERQAEYHRNRSDDHSTAVYVALLEVQTAIEDALFSTNPNPPTVT